MQSQAAETVTAPGAQMRRRLFNVLKKLPCFADLQSRPSSTGLHFRTLDGVRGFVLLLVMMQHVDWQTPAAHPSHYGYLCVWMFFCLSGFLLVQPFSTGQQPLSPRGLTVYYARRLLRIMPLYIVALAVMDFTGYCNLAEGGIQGFHWFWMHLTFRWSDLALWTLKQEMMFYLLLPGILFLIHRIPAASVARPLLLLAFLLGVVSVGPQHLPQNAINHNPAYLMPFYIGYFIAGVAGGCFVHTKAAQWLRNVKHPACVADLLTLALLVSLLLQSPYPPSPSDASWMGQIYNGISFSLLLASLALYPLGMAHRLFSLLPLRAVGIVGYSFYIWHDVMVVRLGAGITDMAWKSMAVLVSTYVISCFTYCLLERPFMNLGRSLH